MCVLFAHDYETIMRDQSLVETDSRSTEKEGWGFWEKKKPNKLAHIRNKWKMRACGGCLSMDRLDNSLSVSLPS